MGPFEPVVCQEGWYCPPDKHGLETLPCPEGTYCQPGAATPTPCAIGSYCPEKSQRQVFLIPILLLVVVDIILIVLLLFYLVKKRFSKTREAHGAWRPTGKKDLKAAIRGYKELSNEHEDEDREMMPMNATYIPGADAWTGFEAALDLPIPVTAEEMEDYE